MLDLIVYIIFRGAIWLLNLLPLEARVSLLVAGLRVITLVRPKYLKFARQNLELAFPGERQRQEQILEQSYASLARIVVDITRLHGITADWAKTHIDARAFLECMARARAGSNIGVLFATGHLGSFEMLAHVLSLVDRPFSFVVRPFKSKLIDAWWRRTREALGNKAISRDGAFREIIRMLRRGIAVGVLFDQNVRREHGVFVPWFGRPAATTKAFGYAAISTEAPVYASYLRYLSNDHYRIEIEEVPMADLYTDVVLTKEQKVLKITERVSNVFQAMILGYPEGWFWMHRRWRTVPEGEKEDFYS